MKTTLISAIATLFLTALMFATPTLAENPGNPGNPVVDQTSNAKKNGNMHNPPPPVEPIAVQRQQITTIGIDGSAYNAASSQVNFDSDRATLNSTLDENSEALVELGVQTEGNGCIGVRCDEQRVEGRATAKEQLISGNTIVGDGNFEFNKVDVAQAGASITVAIDRTQVVNPVPTDSGDGKK